jgi:hypothetical protein
MGDHADDFSVLHDGASLRITVIKNNAFLGLFFQESLSNANR